MGDGRREPADFFLRFCECLNRCDVRYVVAGSEAAAFHGAPRYSANFDAFVLAPRANLFWVVAALEAFGRRYGAVPGRFIGLDDRVASKRAADRPKDLADVHG